MKNVPNHQPDILKLVVDTGATKGPNSPRGPLPLDAPVK